MPHARPIGFVALALAAGLLCGAAAYGQQPQPQPTQPGQPAQPGHWGGWLQQKLGLTDDQMAKIRDIHRAQRDNNKQLYQNLRSAQLELRRAALNGADTTKQAAEVERLLALTVQARIQTLQQIGAILTPQQREAYANLMPGGWMRHHHPRGAPQSQPTS